MKWIFISLSLYLAIANYSLRVRIIKAETRVAVCEKELLGP
jgi:hypothetical protein